MTALRVLVADKCAETTKHITNQLIEWGHQVVGTTSSRSEAKQLYRRERPNLTLIALHLDGYGTGIELARFIRKQSRSTPFIFLTKGLDRRQIDLIKPTLPAGLLVKPIRTELLYANVEIALHHFQVQATRAEGPVITLVTGDENVVLPLADILYLEADHVYVQVYTATGKRIMQRRSLTDLLKQLPAGEFVQTHRSFAVNVRKLSRWDKRHVYVQGRAVPMSRGRRGAVLAVLEQGA